MPDMSININSIETGTDYLECMMTGEIKEATIEGYQLRCAINLCNTLWPSTLADVIKEIQPYWSFRDEVVSLMRLQSKADEQ